MSAPGSRTLGGEGWLRGSHPSTERCEPCKGGFSAVPPRTSVCRHVVLPVLGPLARSLAHASFQSSSLLGNDNWRPNAHFPPVWRRRCVLPQLTVAPACCFSSLPRISPLFPAGRPTRGLYWPTDEPCRSAFAKNAIRYQPTANWRRLKRHCARHGQEGQLQTSAITGWAVHPSLVSRPPRAFSAVTNSAPKLCFHVRARPWPQSSTAEEHPSSAKARRCS